MAFRILCWNTHRIPARLVLNPLFVSQWNDLPRRPSMSRTMWTSSYQLLRSLTSTASTFTASSSSHVSPMNEALRSYDYHAVSGASSFICQHAQIQFPDHQKQQIRFKHSSTQIKRLYKKHPARLRVEKRIWNIDRKEPRVIFEDNFPRPPELTDTSDVVESSLPAISDEIDTPPPQLLYPRVYTPPTKLPNGWFEPMDPAQRPTYPFLIKRTKNKPKDAIGFLPIYTKYRKDGTKVITRIKKVTGNLEVFLRELRIVLSLPQPANQLQSYDAIRMRTGNVIEIQGHRANEIREWLGGLGF